MANFQSTTFYLSQWANQSKETIKTERRDPLLLDVSDSETARMVCKGQDCILFYDTSDNQYHTFGGCKRKTLCTDTRILKDKLYIKTGTQSATINCINYDKQLKNW